MSHWKRWGGPWIVCSLLAAACGATDPEEEPSSVRVLTFNAGLAPNYEDHVDERTQPVIDALARSATELDVLCVQEFWREADWQKLVTAVSGELLHALRFEPKPGASCTEAEAKPLLDCVELNCAGTEDRLACAMTKCPDEVAVLSGGCADCLVQNIALPLDEMYTACVDPNATGGDSAIFGGVYDPGLLTRSEPLEKEMQELSSYFVRAGVLYAKVPRKEGEPIAVFCTHLGSELDGIDYQGPFGSWEGEHAQQESELLAYVAEKAPTGPVMILGDLNTGVGEWDSHYQTLLEAGYQCPAMDAQICTYCPENTFRADDGAPKLIDHVLLRELSAARVEKALTEVVTFKAGESDVTSSLSDHYGLSASVH